MKHSVIWVLVYETLISEVWYVICYTHSRFTYLLTWQNFSLLVLARITKYYSYEYNFITLLQIYECNARTTRLLTNIQPTEESLKIFQTGINYSTKTINWHCYIQLTTDNVTIRLLLQCFHTVGWETGRSSGAWLQENLTIILRCDNNLR